ARRLPGAAETAATTIPAATTDTAALRAILLRARASILWGAAWWWGTRAARSRSIPSSSFRSSSITIAPHVRSQLGEAPRDEGPDRPRPTSEDLRHPSLGEVLVDAQDDGGALACRQELEVAPQLVP